MKRFLFLACLLGACSMPKRAQQAQDQNSPTCAELVVFQASVIQRQREVLQEQGDTLQRIGDTAAACLSREIHCRCVDGEL